MKYAILAAGEGSRLCEEGVEDPKPLVKVGGEHLVDRLCRIFRQNGANEMAVVCNNRTPQTYRHLKELSQHLQGLSQQHLPPLHIHVETTLSSMHSLYALSPWLKGDEPFLVTTVDTIFDEDEFREYITSFQSAVTEGYDAMMVVTDYIDDEKPLYVDVADDFTIRGFFDTADYPATKRYVSGGIYGLTPQTLNVLEHCISNGESRMRNFQRALVAEGLRLKAFPFTKVLDIDHKRDIEKAEAFLEEMRK